MRRYRPRFTVKQLMIAVAIAGGVFELISMGRRSAAYHQHYIGQEFLMRKYDLKPIYYRHDDVVSILYRPPSSSARDDEANKRKFEYHKKMAEKYKQAARYPWLTVEPDPRGPSRP